MTNEKDDARRDSPCFGAHGDLPRPATGPSEGSDDGKQEPDMVCEHGTAMDVHCCNCHSGFIFDVNHVCEVSKTDWIRRYMQRFQDVAGLTEAQAFACATAEAFEVLADGFEDDPEGAADMEMSYWSD